MNLSVTYYPARFEYMRRRIPLLLAVSLCFVMPVCVRAQAGPPLLTDDPDTPGDHHWEINLAMTFSQTPSERLLGLPLLDVNYGLGQRLQLKAELPWLIRQDRNDTGTESGWGSTNLGVKWRFINQDKQGFAMSVYPQLEFRTSSASVRKGLIEGGAELRLPVEVSHDFGNFAVDGEVGYQIVQREKDEWIYGFAVARKMSKRLELLGELHGESRANLTDNEVVFNVGGRYNEGKRYTVLFSSGRSLGTASGDRPQWIAYAGLQFHF
jgi:hypothetical protein